MRNKKMIASSFLVLLTFLTGKVDLLAQTGAAPPPAQETVVSDTRAIEAIVHGNPSDHFAEDGSFTNIFGTVRYGREEFRQRHIEIAQTIFKGTSVKTSIAKLRF